MENDIAEKYDLIVIGAGPGGYHTAIHGAKMGLRTGIIEKNKIGGTCLNAGCIPTKVMLHGVAAKQEAPSYLEVSLDAAKLFAGRERAIGQLTAGVEFLLKKNKVDVFKGTAGFLDRNSLEISYENGETELVGFDKAIIATGSTVKTLPFLDAVGKYVINSDQATHVDAGELPASICIIGGGVIGVEFAYIYSGLGCQVTVVEALDRLLINEEPMTSQFVRDTLRKKGVRVFTGTKIEKVDETDGMARLTAGGETFCVEQIMSAVGRMPCTEGLKLEALGVEMLDQRGNIAVDDHLETNCPGIYAIGDVIGKIMLAHVASAQGVLAVNNICSGIAAAWNDSFVPRCIYIEPEIASVGVVEEGLKGRTDYVTALYPFESNGKALALEKAEGFIKVIASKEEKTVLGVTIVGARATDLIGTAMEIVKNKMTVRQLESSIYPHPTFSEALQEGILKLENKAVHA